MKEVRKEERAEFAAPAAVVAASKKVGMNSSKSKAKAKAKAIE